MASWDFLAFQLPWDVFLDVTLVLSWGFHGMFCTPDVPLEVPLLTDSNISLLGGLHGNIRFLKLAGKALEIRLFLLFVCNE